MAVHDSKLNTEDPKTEDHRKFKPWAVSEFQISLGYRIWTVSREKKKQSK